MTSTNIFVLHEEWGGDVPPTAPLDINFMHKCEKINSKTVQLSFWQFQKFGGRPSNFYNYIPERITNADFENFPDFSGRW